MTKLLIIADDFTGALDTGVQFASRGASTRVLPGNGRELMAAAKEADVLVVNTNSRHKTPAEAYKAVYSVASEAARIGIPFVYKKTDSALRGNVGSELAAAMDALGVPDLVFVPAFPDMGRVTREGKHFVNGVPVAESVFGSDPFDPVCCSGIADLLHRQTDKPVILHPAFSYPQSGEAGIHAFDAETDDDLRLIACTLSEERLRLSAGCAGFASALADRLQINGPHQEVPFRAESLVVLCGSLNPVTVQQLDCAEQAGYRRVRFSPDQKLHWGDHPGEEAASVAQWARWIQESPLLMLDANDELNGTTDSKARLAGYAGDEIRERIADNLGRAAKDFLDLQTGAALLCTGGDTLFALMNAAGMQELTPLCELAPGVVLTAVSYRGENRYIISKSGGFGDKNLFCNLIAAPQGAAV